MALNCASRRITAVRVAGPHSPVPFFPVHYDALIIGAGLSGLAAGIRLAYYEKNVCVLERHTTIGGLNSFYRLRGRNYDVGLHAVTNYAAPGTKTGPDEPPLRTASSDDCWRKAFSSSSALPTLPMPSIAQT